MRRGRLTAWWVGFIIVWCASVVVVVFPVNYLACNAENAGPKPGSAQEDYCHGVRDYLNWGEPSELTTPIPFLLPIAILVMLGGYGIWRRNRRFMSVVATCAFAALVAHAVVLLLLPG